MSIREQTASPAQEGLDAAFIAALLVAVGFVLVPGLVNVQLAVLIPVVVGFVVGVAVSLLT